MNLKWEKKENFSSKTNHVLNYHLSLQDYDKQMSIWYK